MVATNGAYGDSVLKNNTHLRLPTNVPLLRSHRNCRGGGGMGPVELIKHYTADELAERFGIVNDYATILKENKTLLKSMFDETETTMKRC